MEARGGAGLRMLSISQNWACRKKVRGFLREIVRTECTVCPTAVWGHLLNKKKKKKKSFLVLESMQFPFSLLDLPRIPSQDTQQFLWLLSHVIALKTKAQELAVSHCNVVIHLTELWPCHNTSRFGSAQSCRAALLIIPVPSPQSWHVAAAVPRPALPRPAQSPSWARFHSCLRTSLSLETACLPFAMSLSFTLPVTLRQP